MNLIVIFSVVLGISLEVVNADYWQPQLQRKSLRPAGFKQCPLVRLKNGETRLRQRGRLLVFRCRPSYLLIGEKYAACISGRWDTAAPICVKSGCPEIPIPANAVVYPQFDNATLTLFCHSGYQRVGSARTYCDGYEWDRPLGKCRGINTEPETACDFEADDMCGWTQDTNHDFDWKRTNGMLRGSLLLIGPPYDHTFQKPLAGFYMFLDMKDGEDGDKARIVSPSYNQNQSINACFRLFYHMYGLSPGTLNVYAKPLSVDIVDAIQSDVYKKFQVNGNQKNLWKEGFFSIPEFSEEFQIIIEGVSTFGHESHIAIDDVALLSGDECKSHVSDNGTKEEKGYIATQSCVDRCDETETTLTGGLTDYLLLPNITLIKKCDCFYGCEDIDTCCSNYKAICALAATTPEENEETTPVTSPSTTSTTTTTMRTTTRTVAATTTSTTARTTKMTTSSTTARTTKMTSTSTSTTPKTLEKTTTTQTSTTIQNPTKQSSKPTTYRSDSDYIADVTLTGYGDDYEDEDFNPVPPKRSQEYNFPQPKPSHDLLYLLITGFILFGVVVAVAGGIYQYRRKKYDPRNYKDKANKASSEQENDEFSEVRYLTSDEHLDFALQTPRELTE